MNQKIYCQFILATGIFLSLTACNQGGQKEGETKTNDTTTNAQTTVVPSSAPEASMDAVKVAPNLYKVLSDSLGIRVLEATYKPGDSSAMHGHPVNAMYVVQGGTATFTGKDGSKTERNMKTGMTGISDAESHSVKNTGKTTTKVIVVEVNRPMGTMAQDAATDATKVAPNLYKLKNDSLGLRVIEVSYKPGQSSAMHAHPDAALYVIQGGTTEFTTKDGSKQTLALKAGTTMVMPAGVHSVRNVGTTTTKSILVEVNRPGK